MARLSFEEWQKKQGDPSGSTEQGMKTPADTIPEKRPRLTFDEWQASQQQAPTIQPEVAQDVATAGPEFTPQASPVASAEASGLQLSPYVTGGSFGTGVEQIQEQGRVAGEAMSPESKAATKEFIQEEGMPLVGGVAAVAALPASATAGFGGWALSALVSGGGSTAGEFVEQVFKKEGFIEADPSETPKDWGDVVAASISQGAEDTAFGAGVDAVTRLVPKAYRSIFTLSSRLKNDNKHMVNVLRENGGQILASDLADGLFINLADSAATHSFTKIGAEMKGIREAQAQVIGEAAQRPLTEMMEKAGIDALDEYQEATLKALPDEVLASHLTTVIKDGERAAKDVGGALYNAMDDVAESVGTKTVTQYDYIDTGKLDGKGNPIYSMKPKQVEVPIHSVDTRGAREHLSQEIEIIAKDLKGDAAVDYTNYAKSQLRLFSMNDDISISGAVRQMKTMSKDARALARSNEPGAAEKRMFLLKSMDELQKAMDFTAQEMADAGLSVGGRSIMDVKAEADKLWKGVNEDFGNRYVAQMVDKANAKEGAAATLAQSFMQNRESADAIMTAVEAAEKAGMETGKYGLVENVGKTRAAIGAKVYENMLSKVLVAGDDAGAYKMLNTPDSRKALQRLLGDENLELLDTSIRSIVEAKGKGLNVGAFTQFARESSALIDLGTAQVTQQPRVVATLMAPGLLAKGLKSEKVVAKLQEANQATTLNKAMYAWAEAMKAAVPTYLADYDTLTPEEREKAEYKARLAQM